MIKSTKPEAYPSPKFKTRLSSKPEIFGPVPALEFFQVLKTMHFNSLHLDLRLFKSKKLFWNNFFDFSIHKNRRRRRKSKISLTIFHHQNCNLDLYQDLKFADTRLCLPRPSVLIESPVWLPVPWLWSGSGWQIMNVAKFSMTKYRAQPLYPCYVC